MAATFVTIVLQAAGLNATGLRFPAKRSRLSTPGATVAHVG